MKTLFIILFLSEGPEAVCVTSATFLCCTPATNTDVAGPGAGCLRFVYLGCKALENLSLSCTNGHLTLYWELHSHCLFCISNIDLFNFLRFMSVSFRNSLEFFFISQKMDFISQNFLFVTQTVQKEVAFGAIVIVGKQSLMHTWGANIMPLILFCCSFYNNKNNTSPCIYNVPCPKRLWSRAHVWVQLLVWDDALSHSGLVKSTWVTLVPATQTLGDVGEITHMQRHHLT